MGTKKTSTTTRQFDPASMGVFQGLQAPIGQTLQEYLKNPDQSAFFGLRLAQALGGARTLGQRNLQNFGQNLQAGGFGGSDLPAFQQAMLSQIGRGNAGLESQAHINTLLGFEGLRRQALGQAQAYQPLETGQTNVQKSSGLGTWLPQALGMGLGLALAPATGGASLGLAGAFGGRSASGAFDRAWNPLLGPSTPIGGGPFGGLGTGIGGGFAT